MGDMGDIFNDMREHNREVRQNKREKFEPLLKEMGATEKSDGVWDFKNWLLYPTKGFAMHKKHTDIRHPLAQFIQRNTPKHNY